MEQVWKTTDGRSIPYYQLTDEHLINILNLIERCGLRYVGMSADHTLDDGGALDVYYRLRNESYRRGIRYRDWKNVRLKEGDFVRQAINPRNNHLSRKFRENFDPCEDADIPPEKPGRYLLGSLRPGDRFLRHPGGVEHMVLKTFGEVGRGLAHRGYVPRRDEDPQHHFLDRDDVSRVLVATIPSGSTYLMGVDAEVYRVNKP